MRLCLGFVQTWYDVRLVSGEVSSVLVFFSREGARRLLFLSSMDRRGLDTPEWLIPP